MNPLVKIILFSITLSISVPIAPEWAMGQTKSAADVFREANEFFQAGLYKKAIRAYKQSVAIDPDFKEAWYNLGVSYGRKKKFKEEVSAYQKALALDPKYSRAVFNLAIALEDSGDLPGAIQTYEAFLKNAGSERDMADAFVNVGILYTRTGRYEEAIQSYEEAIKRDPDLADASYNLGLTYAKKAASVTGEESQKKHLNNQVEAYKTAIKQRPGHHKAWYNLADAYHKLGETDLEIDAYEQAIRIRSNYPQALYNLAYALDEKGEKEKALEAWKSYVKVAEGRETEEAFLKTARAEVERLSKIVLQGK